MSLSLLLRLDYFWIIVYSVFRVRGSCISAAGPVSFRFTGHISLPDPDLSGIIAASY